MNMQEQLLNTRSQPEASPLDAKAQTYPIAAGAPVMQTQLAVAHRAWFGTQLSAQDELELLPRAVDDIDGDVESAGPDTLAKEVTLGATVAALEQERDALRTETENLHTALLSSREIGAAIGILMERNSLSYDASFTLLRYASQDLNCKLRDVAAQLLLTPPSAIPRVEQEGPLARVLRLPARSRSPQAAAPARVADAGGRHRSEQP